MPKNFEDAVAGRQSHDAEQLALKRLKQASHVSAYTLRRLERGITESPARTGCLPPLLKYSEIDSETGALVTQQLLDQGVIARVIDEYRGAGDTETMVYVTGLIEQNE